MNLISDPAKNSKALYYLRNHLESLIPNGYYRLQLNSKIALYPDDLHEAIQKRVSYYNQLKADFSPSEFATTLAAIPNKPHSAYYFDFRQTSRYFDSMCRFDRVFGDVIHVPDFPSFVKSRPIDGENTNSVLLKLNKVRHYVFVRDRQPFDAKTGRLVWRGKVKPHQHRFDVVDKWYRHPACDIGQSNRVMAGDDPAKTKPFLPISDQLKYKYILSLEGNDVATNLKWILSSNSLCLMRKPRYETWFMEGSLIPGHHYAELKDDFSDIEEKIAYFDDHPDEAKQIIDNANRWVAQFQDQRRELLISLLVMQKYLLLSRQLEDSTCDLLWQR